VLGYRGASYALARIPLSVSEPIARLLFRVGYLAWPAKRRIIDANAGHILGLPASHNDVRRLARDIYDTYAGFALEVMRLPSLPADEPLRMVQLEGPGHENFIEHWHKCHDEGRGIIAVSGHMGSIEVFAGAYALQGIPTYGLADDSAFPELFETLNASRARWGVTIIPWRKLREIFRIMRKPSLLGMIVDWGYRSDDVPVRLLGDWTTLPAGPATLSARTGASLVPVLARRQPDGRYLPVMYDPIVVADNSEAAIAAATQGIADALGDMIRQAPAQWYTFKPIWPASTQERDALRARHAAIFENAEAR
jgi:lauroyl/myristoyl acyltransferase